MRGFMKFKKINVAVLSSMFLSASVFADSASTAKTFGTIATDLGGQVKSVTALMIIAGTLLGVVFMVIGGVQLKKHGDNPQQVPLAKPLIFLAAGALLFGLGSTSDMMQKSVFGGGRVSGGTEGKITI